MSAHATRSITFAPHRVAAMVLRYLYLLRSSWPRVLELIYWPTMQLFVWGFLQLYISQNAGFFARAGGMFIGRGAAVGHPVPRAARIFGVVSRGDVGAQPRQSDDQPLRGRSSSSPP